VKALSRGLDPSMLLQQLQRAVVWDQCLTRLVQPLAAVALDFLRASHCSKSAASCEGKHRCRLTSAVVAHDRQATSAHRLDLGSLDPPSPAPARAVAVGTFSSSSSSSARPGNAGGKGRGSGAMPETSSQGHVAACSSGGDRGKGESGQDGQEDTSSSLPPAADDGSSSSSGDEDDFEPVRAAAKNRLLGFGAGRNGSSGDHPAGASLRSRRGAQGAGQVTIVATTLQQDLVAELLEQRAAQEVASGCCPRGRCICDVHEQYSLQAKCGTDILL
jgi:hypothetical protein